MKKVYLKFKIEIINNKKNKDINLNDLKPAKEDLIYMVVNLCEDLEIISRDLIYIWKFE